MSKLDGEKLVGLASHLVDHVINTQPSLAR